MNENMNIKAKKRDTSLDAIAGLLILHMITLHCVQNTIGQLGQYEIISSILMFFMPWFFFKNGMFINDKSTFNWKKDASRLLKPFVVYSAIGLAVGAFYYCIAKDEVFWKYVLKFFYNLFKNGSIQGNLPLWFLLSLFLARMVFANAKIYTNKWVLTFAGLFVGLGLSLINVHTIGWIVNLPICMSFLVFGSIFRELQYDKRILTLAFLVFVIIETFSLSKVDIHGNELIQGHYILWWITSLCGIIVINNVFKFINLRFLVIIGRNSMEYYVSHWIVMLALLFACYLIGIVRPQWLFGIIWGGDLSSFFSYTECTHGNVVNN